MCQLIAKPAGKQITRIALKLCWLRNPDGAGFAYVEGDKVIIKKGFMDSFDEFWEAYQPHQDKQCLIHFRMATHGSKCPDNCHPFEVSPNVVIGHNGVLMNFTPKKGDDRSDSRIFAEEYVAKIMATIPAKQRVDWVPTLEYLLDWVIGYNKIVIMTAKQFHIMHPHQGDWANGVWYSNGVPTDKSYRFSISRGYWREVTDSNGKKQREFVGDPEIEALDEADRALAKKNHQYEGVTENYWEAMGGYNSQSGAPNGHGYGYPQPPKKKNSEVLVLNSTNRTTSSTSESIPGVGTTTVPLPSSPSSEDEIEVEAEVAEIGEGMSQMDLKVFNMMDTFESWKAGGISNEEWWMALYMLSTHEFTEFIRWQATEDGVLDRDLVSLLRRERDLCFKHVTKVAMDKEKAIRRNSQGGRPSAGPSKGLSYPPWLEKEYRVLDLVDRVDPKFVKHFASTPRGFLIDGIIYSRNEAKRMLKTSCPFPKLEGLFKPLYDNKLLVKGWERLAGPDMVKEKPVARPKNEADLLGHHPGD